MSGGTIIATSSAFGKQYSDTFSYADGPFNPDIWELQQYDDIYSISYPNLSARFDPVAGDTPFYSLKGKFRLKTQNSTNFAFTHEATFSAENHTDCGIFISIEGLNPALNKIELSANIANPGAGGSSIYNLKLVKILNGVSSEKTFGNESGSIKATFVYNEGNFDIYRKTPTGPQLLDSFEFFNAPFGDSCVVKIGIGINQQNLLISGSPVYSIYYTPKAFSFLPVIKGVPLFGDRSIVVASSSSGQDAFFNFTPAAPGNFDLLGFGGDPLLVGFASDAGTVEVLDTFDQETATGFVVTPDKVIDFEGSPVLDCPVSARPAETNAGSYYIGNTCFDDGTDLDEDEVSILFKKYGDASKSSSSQLPGFIFSENGKNYGMNLRYEVMQKPEAFLFQDNRRVHLIRCLNLSNNNKFYYGVLTDCDVSGYDTFNISLSYERYDDTLPAFFEIYIQIESNQLLPLGISETYPADGTPVNTQVNIEEDLPIGLYKIYSRNLKINSVKIKRSSESSSGFRTIAKHSIGLTYSPETNDSVFSRDTIAFEAKPYFGNLFYIYEDVTSGTFIRRIIDGSKNVFLGTDSVSAVELSNGDVSIFYMIDKGEGLFPDAITSAYVRFEEGVGPYQAVAVKNTLKCSEFNNIYCFDIVSDKNKNIHILYNSKTDSDLYYDEPEIEEGGFRTDPKPRNHPVLKRGMYSISLTDQEIGIREDTSTVTVIDKPPVFIPLTTVEEQLRYCSYDSVRITEETEFDTELPRKFYKYIARAEVGFIRASYDSLRNSILVSTIENRRRIPCLFYGIGQIWKEVAIPSLDGLNPDDSDFYKKELVLNSYYGKAGIGLVLFSAYNISSAVYNDGTIHCAVNSYYNVVDPESSLGTAFLPNRRAENCIFFIDGEILSLERKYLIDIDQSGNPRPGYIFAPYIKQFKNQILHSYADSLRWTFDISRFFNYSELCVGGLKREPMLLQSGNPDQFPMLSSDREQWTNLFRNSMYETVDTTGSILVPTLSGLVPLASLDTPDQVYPMYLGIVQHIERNMEATNGIANSSRSEGMFFRARISYEFDAQYTNKPIMMKTVSVLYRTATETYFVDAFIEINTHSCTVGVNDESTRTSTMTYNLDLSTPHDFLIFTTGNNVLFVIKKVNDSNSYDYRSEVIAFYSTRMPTQIVNIEDDKESQVFIGRDNAVGLAANREYYSLHSLGWGFTSLDIWRRNPWRGGSIDATGRADREASPDSLINLRSLLNPHIFYPVKTFLNNRSYQYHWPNGFNMYFSGKSINSYDSFSLKRHQIFQPEVLGSNYLSAVWRSLTDTQDVYLVCDAEGAGLDKFVFDSVILKGCNFKEAYVVGRNNQSDPWSPICHVDFSKYKLEDLSHSEAQSGFVTSGNFTFAPGKFNERDYYLLPDNERAAKIESAIDSSVMLLTKEDPSAENGVVFSCNRFLKLLKTHSYRYVALKIPAFETYHGYFKMEKFDFGMFREVPLEYSTNIGTGMQLSYGVTSYMAEDDSPFYYSSNTSKTYEFSYTLSDSKTLMKVVSMLDRVTNNRRPIWVVDGRNHEFDSFSLCLLGSSTGIQPVVEEDGDSYYKFSISLKSIDGE
jgi:hypothetical protein